MKFTSKIIYTFGLAALLFNMVTINLFAQQAEITVPEEVKVIPFQLTLISPLGTNGLNSSKVANNASINMLAGISAGVRGAEIGGLVNVSLGNITGAQIAGLFNGSNGAISGVQLSGLGSYNKGQLIGAQVSGLGNVNSAAVTGAQVGGLFGYAMDEVNGAQISGLANTVVGRVDGVQLSGIVNVATQAVKGVQITGIVNTTIGNVNGLQLAGITNVVTQTIDGTQIGLVNYAKTVKGFQLGLINISDSVERGVALGLITFVRHGYHKFEVEGNETFYVNATFKSGVRHLYMIYTVGYKFRDETNFWAPGFGVGTIFGVGTKFDINADLITRQVNEGEWWTEELNLLNSLSVNVAYNFTDRLAIYGGPSFNVSVSQIEDSEGNIIGGSYLPDWGFFDKTYDNETVKMYIGFKAGIRF